LAIYTRVIIPSKNSLFQTIIIRVLIDFNYVSWRKSLEITRALLWVFVCVFPGNGLQKIREILSKLKSHMQIQDRQGTYNVALTRVPAINYAVGKKHYIHWVCVCSLRYPARNSNAPYCHLWSVRHYYTCPRYVVNGRIKKKSYWT
jgi:hypothetical protein